MLPKQIVMVIVYDKKSKQFKSYKDLGVASIITGRSLRFLKAMDISIEDDRMIVGNLVEIKSNRGGKR